METTAPTSPSGVALSDDARRAAMRSVFTAWIFGAFWMYIVTGVAQTRLAKLIGLPPFGFGLLAAMPFAGALMQLPTSLFIERYGHHKPVFIAAGLLHRALWIVVGLVPWMLTGAWSWVVFLGAVSLSAAANHVANPIWVTWMSELVPPRIRGRFFSNRTRAGQGVGLGITLLVGWLLDRAGAAGPAAHVGVMALLFCSAGLFGMADFLVFLRVPPPSARKPRQDLGLADLLREPLQDRGFRSFLLYVALLTCGTAYTGQFIWLQLLDVAGVSNSRASLLMVVVPLIVSMSSSPVWGRILDRVGTKRILTVCACCVFQGGAAWIFVQGPYWWVGYAAVLVSSMAWPGVELAHFNLLLSRGDPLRGRRYGSVYPAITSFVVAVSGVLSGLLAGVIGQAVESWSAEWGGFRFGYHSVLLGLSLFIRHARLGARQVLFQAGTGVFSNLFDLVILPGRLLLRAGEWTYRLRPGAQTARRPPPR
jgi:MFS family permease